MGAGLEFVRFNRFRAFDARQREAVQDAARFYVGHRKRRRNGAPGVEVVDDELVADAQAHPGESLAAQVRADRRDRRISDFPAFERRERGEAEGDLGDRAPFAGGDRRVGDAAPGAVRGVADGDVGGTVAVWLPMTTPVPGDATSRRR